MALTQIIVTIAGLILSTFVIWFFFFSTKERAKAVAKDEGIQEAYITVKGGYSPDVIVVQKDKPVRLNFLRQETDDCSEKVIFPDFNKSATLIPFKTTTVEFKPDRQGEFEFTCGMGMLRGKLVVEHNGN